MTAVINAPKLAATIVVRRRIAAPAVEIFDAWLDPAGMAVWMRPCTPEPRQSDVKVDARVGGAFEIVMHVPSGPVLHTGVYRTIDRPRRLAFTWNSVHAGAHDSLVTIEFHPDGDVTELVLTHARLPAGQGPGHTGGWTDILNGLAQRLEAKSA
ncbi:MAG: SRPBCC domain-containing protein [Burkholderiales bacterium]|nr:SRPBCC domain-containing protein [Burkholderiales bacterium]